MILKPTHIKESYIYDVFFNKKENQLVIVGGIYTTINESEKEDKIMYKTPEPPVLQLLLKDKMLIFELLSLSENHSCQSHA